MAARKPEWFKEWLNNDWFHLRVKVDVIIWCLGFVAAMTAAVLTKLFLDS